MKKDYFKNYAFGDNGIPKHYEDFYNSYAIEAAKQIADEIDEDIINSLRKKNDNPIILTKRNHVPNNRVVI